MGLFKRLFKRKNKVSENIKNNTESSAHAKNELSKTEPLKEENVVIVALQNKEDATSSTESVPKSAKSKELPAVTKVKSSTQDSKKSTKKTDVIQKNEEAKEDISEVVASVEEKRAFTGKFEINRSKDGKKFFFNLFASNKVGIATSQMYSSAQSALTGVKSVIVNAPKAPIEDQTLKTFETLPNPKWEIYLDNGNKYRFRLNATNGSCVCHSQGYTTKTACKNGIDSIIRSSKNAEIIKTYLTKDE